MRCVLEQHASWIIGSMICPLRGVKSDCVMAVNAVNNWRMILWPSQQRRPLCGPPKANLRVRRSLRGLGRPAVQVQLENPRHHDDGLRAVSILEHSELQCFRSTDEQAAAEPFLILHDPMAMPVLSDAEQGR
jgi:hypothetical protein